MRAYPPQEVENQNYKEILVYSHYSPQEMQLIMQDAFSKISKIVGKNRIADLFGDIENDRFNDQTCKLDYLIRLENSAVPQKTNLSFLSVFDLSTPKTASERIARALNSDDFEEFPIKTKKLNTGTSHKIRLLIDNVSLVKYIYKELIGEEE